MTTILGGWNVVGAIFFSFFFILLPGWALYISGHRKEKNAAKAQLQLQSTATTTTNKQPADYDAVKGVLMIICLVVGVPALIIGIIILHWGVIIFGLVLGGGGLIWLSWEQGWAEVNQGRRHGGGHGSSNHWNDYYMNRWGSFNAKRNMWRGHKYSKKR